MDFFLLRKHNHPASKDCKVIIPGESLTKQRIVVLNVFIKILKTMAVNKRCLKTRWEIWKKEQQHLSIKCSNSRIELRERNYGDVKPNGYTY